MYPTENYRSLLPPPPPPYIEASAVISYYEVYFFHYCVIHTTQDYTSLYKKVPVSKNGLKYIATNPNLFIRVNLFLNLPNLHAQGKLWKVSALESFKPYKDIYKHDIIVIVAISACPRHKYTSTGTSTFV